MDISSLLSPSEASRPGSQPTVTLAHSPAQVPHPHVRRTLSGPRKTGTDATPLSQSTVPSKLPQHILSPKYKTSSSPLRSPSAVATSTPPVVGAQISRNSSSSTPSMDTLADLASMQNQQQPISTPPILRSRESYESQLSPSTIFPHVPTVSVTSNLRPSFEVAMVETPRHNMRTDFAGCSLPLEIQQRASLLSVSLQERPSAFVSHVELIKILHKGFVDHVYPPSSPDAHGDPHSYDLLQDLRMARENMHRMFAMGEDLWIDCLQDESMLARTTEEKVGVVEKCMIATSQEYGSTKLWKMYGDWMLHCYNAAKQSQSQVSQSEPNEEQMVAEATFDWEAVIDTWQNAAEHTKCRLSDSHLVWDQYIEIMMQQMRICETQDAIAEVKILFEQRLLQPHSTWDNTFQNFSSFITKSTYRDDYEQIMVEMSRSALVASAKATWLARENFEVALQKAQDEGNGDAEYATFTQYLQWEQTPEKHRRLDLDLINAVFQRAELRFPSDATIWEEHALWLIENKYGNKSGASSLTTLDRASRHCPWSGSLWSQYLLVSEASQESFSDTEQIKHKATNTGLLDVGGFEEVLKVHAAWCSYLRRRAFRVGASDEDLDVATMGIRSSIENVQELATKLGMEPNADPQFRLERIYINFLTESGSWDSAREAFRGYIPKYGNSYEFWFRFYDWEMSRWRKFVQNEERSKDGQLGRTTGPQYATAVLKEALRRPSVDWPEHIMRKLIAHCEDHEEVEELQEVIIEVKKSEKLITARRQEEVSNVQQVAPQSGLVQEDAVMNGLHLGKRKREDEEDSESKKKSRAVDVQPSVEQSAVTEEVVKRDRENATILVQGLPNGVTEIKIRKFFRDCGRINNLKLLQGNTSAVVEFDESAAAQYALSRSGRQFEESTISIYLESGSTIYVTNYPAESDEAFFRRNFEKYGDIVDVRLPSLQANAGRRFCYVQFKLSSQAEAALEMEGYEVTPDLMLSVKISDPANRQERSGPVEEDRQLFIRNIDFKINEKKLEAAFSKYGKVESVKIPRDDKDRSKGYGFMTFSSTEEATAALEMNGETLRDRKLAVTIARKRQPTQHGTIRNDRSATPSMVNGDAGSPAASVTSTVIASAANGDEIRARKIALVNVPDTVNANRIQALAGQYGTLVKVNIQPKHQGALLEYADAASAGKAALALEGHEIIAGRALRVVPVSEMFKHEAEVKVDRIQVGKKAAADQKPGGLQPASVKRPGQAGQRKAGGLGQKKVLGFQKANESVNGDENGGSKSNDDFRALMIQGKK